eukprot:GHVR01154328.1.p1 GENE.GHVR01154328.1~~GHVR01154328.1.p1  ORF type:complete len:125 (-),score=14.01 GHVR01154328.1:101-475(-)
MRKGHSRGSTGAVIRVDISTLIKSPTDTPHPFSLLLRVVLNNELTHKKFCAISKKITKKIQKNMGYEKRVRELEMKAKGATEQIAVIVDLNQTISATYVQAEVQAISDKVDELLAALRLGRRIQ